MTEVSWKRVAWALLGVHLAWRTVRWAQGFPIWGDEAMVAVNFWDASYRDLVRPLEYGQIAPLLWLWLEKAVFDLFGPWERALRFPSYLAGVLAALLLFRLAFRLLPARAATLGFAVFAASYYPVRHGAELKPYSLDLLVALSCFSLAWDWLADPVRCPRWRKTALVALCILGPWLSLPSLFVAGGCLLVLGAHAWRRGGPGVVVPYGIWGLALATSLAWMVHLFAGPHAESAAWLREMDMWTGAFPPADWWRWPLWLVERHCGYMSAYPTGGRDFGSTATAVFMLAGAVLWWRGGRRPALALLLAPLLYNLVAAALGRYPYGGSVRVSLYLAPAVCLLAGSALEALCARGGERPRVGVAALLGLMAVLGLGRDLVKPQKAEGDRVALELAEWMGERVQPTERVLGYAWMRAPGVPGFAEQVGSLARLRFQLRRALPVPVEWDAPEPAPGARVWVFGYRDDNQTATPFPEADFLSWRARWTAARGPAERRRSWRLGRDEALHLVVLPAAD